MPSRRPTWCLLALLVVAPLGAALPTPAPATGIGPGTHLLIDVEGQTVSCTAGWLFQDASRTYLSLAGHCLLPASKNATHGPDADAAPSATVRACIDACTFGGQSGFLVTGTLVELGPVAYARQRTGDAQIGHDFGLVVVPSHLASELRAGLPVWGRAASVAPLRAGEVSCWYGAGLLVGETFATMGREGVGVATLPDGSWRMAGAGMIGDSGSAVATCSGDGSAVAAVGVLTHLAGGLVAGTTMARGEALAREAGLSVQPLL